MPSARPGEFVGDYDYARSANPTRAALEQALGELEGGQAVAFSSGLAAEHALITVDVRGRSAHGAARRSLRRHVPPRRQGAQPLGAAPTTSSGRPTWTRSTGAVGDETRLIWVETPTNPLLNVVDIAGVVARRGGALVVAVDNTFATPANQRPLELGADFVVHSTTKYLGGHSDVVGGVVVTRDPRVVRAAALRPERGRRRPRTVRLLPRAPRAAHPASAHGGPRAQRRRGRRAAPRNPRRPGRPLAGLQRDGELPPPRRHGIAARTRLFTLAESLGGVESLIEVPQAMTHQSVEGSAAAVPPDLVRLSCGIEDPRDLVHDLRAALG